MNAILLDAGQPETCAPVTTTRSLGRCPVANRALDEVQREQLQIAGFGAVGVPGSQPALYVRGDAWLSSRLLESLRQAPDATVVQDPAGTVLAWIGRDAAPPSAGSVLAADGDSFHIKYAWDLLRLNEVLLAGVREDRIEGQVSPAAHIEGRLVLGAGSRILPGVYMEGTVVIGADCKIGPNCYIRGSTSIGDGCHIGQAVEIKNSILMRGVAIGHLSYCGDSIVGEKTNFGAGTITANFRHDGQSHRSMVGGVLVNTGRRKFGAIIGDDVHTGIHTSIYPGRKLWPHVATLPGDIVKRDVK